MSDRAVRARSRSRGRSGRSSPKMSDKYASWYAEESFDDGYRAGYQRGCFNDGETRGYLDGLNARRMNKAQGDESDNDSTDDERDSTDDEGDDDCEDGSGGNNVDIDIVFVVNVKPTAAAASGEWMPAFKRDVITNPDNKIQRLRQGPPIM